MKTSILCALAILASTSPVHAQRDLLGPGAGFISIGRAGISTSELDDYLAARSYPTFGNVAGTVGLGGYRVLSSGLMLGFEANGLIIGEKPHQGREVGLAGGYATLGLGYLFNVSERSRIYPRLGFGAGGMALWSEAADTAGFDDVLDSPPADEDRETVLGRDGPVLDFGAGFEFVPAGGRGLLLGVRFGYLTGPFTSKWESPDHIVTGGPDASISGPYLRVLVGWVWKN